MMHSLYKGQFDAALQALQDITSIDFSSAAMLAAKINLMNCWGANKDKLLEVVGQKASMQNVPNAAAGEQLFINGRRAIQDYTALPAYIIQSLWDFLAQATHSKAARIEAVTKFSSILGLRCPSEPTYCVIMAIVNMAAKEELDDDSAQKFESFRAHKHIIKKIVDSCEYVHVQGLRVLTLPLKVDNFLDSEWARAAFAAEPAGQCPFSARDFLLYFKSIPLRNTNTRSFSMFQPLQRASAPAVMNLFSRFLAQAAHGQANVEQPRITFLPRGQNTLPAPLALPSSSPGVNFQSQTAESAPVQSPQPHVLAISDQVHPGALPAQTQNPAFLLNVESPKQENSNVDNGLKKERDPLNVIYSLEKKP